MATLPDDVRELLDGPNFVHVASTLPDGGPHVVAIWAGVERGPDGDRIVFFTGPGTRKARNLDRDGRWRSPSSATTTRTARPGSRAGGREADRRPETWTTCPTSTRASRSRAARTSSTSEPERWKYLHLPFSHEPGT